MGRIEYVVEIRNKYTENFIEQVGVFVTYEIAKSFIHGNNFEVDPSCEDIELIEIRYDETGEETNRTSLVY